MRARSYLVSSVKNCLDLRELLVRAGADVIGQKPRDEKDFIDLSPESLDKTTILGLLQSK